MEDRRFADEEEFQTLVNAKNDAVVTASETYWRVVATACVVSADALTSIVAGGSGDSLMIRLRLSPSTLISFDMGCK